MVCAPCKVHRAIVVDKLAFATVVAWMQDHHVCFYCGEYATQKEHVVPRHTLYPTWVVGSCQECNMLAGAEPFISVLDKLLFIRDRRVKRYKKLLQSPDWTDDELQDIGRNLKVAIEAGQRAREVVCSQVNWNPLALRELV